MTISELSIRRPVFATVLALLLLILGIMAALRLTVREYPDVARPVVNVAVVYRGASANVIESRITQVLEDELAGVEGLDKMTSASRDESSRINLEFTVDRDLDDLRVLQIAAHVDEVVEQGDAQPHVAVQVLAQGLAVAADAAPVALRLPLREAEVGEDVQDGGVDGLAIHGPKCVDGGHIDDCALAVGDHDG